MRSYVHTLNSRSERWFLAGWLTGVVTAGVLIAICAVIGGCNSLPQKSPPNDCATHPSGWCTHKAESWDQENLKRHDSGCPTAIYDAPGGNLRLCRP